MAMTLGALPQAPVWVLDDQTGPTGGQALALAGRLGLPFLRMPADAAWRGRAEGAADPAHAAWALGDRTAGPMVVVSAGLRAAARAMTLRARHGSAIVHCARHAHAALPFDLMVTSATTRRPERARIMTSLGPLHVVSPALLEAARRRWRERLAHLPRPHVVLLARQEGRALPGAAAGRLASRLAADVSGRRGSILASVSPSIGAAAVAAIAGGLQGGLHLLHRTGEPGEDPSLGFLGSADAVVVAGGSIACLAEAQATDRPVFGALMDAGGAGALAFARALAAEGRLRPYAGDLSPWPRRPLDETGRIADEVRMVLGLQG